MKTVFSFDLSLGTAFLIIFVFPLQGCPPGLCEARMEMSAPAPAMEKKEAKGGILEASAFPDPGRKASALAVATAAAAAAAVAAQGGTFCFAHLAGSRGVFH